MRIDLSKSECKYREGKLNKKTFPKFQKNGTNPIPFTQKQKSQDPIKIHAFFPENQHDDSAICLIIFVNLLNTKLKI
jgi:hypothetical protein